MAYAIQAERVGIRLPQADSRRPYPVPETWTRLEAEVDDAASQACSIWSEATGIPPELIRQEPGNCLDMSFILQDRLAARGIASRLMEYRRGPGAHYCLETQASNPYNELFVDYTWQQMLASSGLDCTRLPDVLIVPSFRPEPALAAHSIPQKRWPVWTELQRSGVKWRNQPNKSLHRVMTDNGHSLVGI